MARLKEQYQNEFVDALIKKFGYKNIMEVPKLDKIVINMGVGEAKENAKVLDSAVRDMEIISGQRQSPPRRRSLLLTSNSVKVWRSAVRLPCAARECTNSWIAW